MFLKVKTSYINCSNRKITKINQKYSEKIENNSNLALSPNQNMNKQESSPNQNISNSIPNPLFFKYRFINIISPLQNINNFIPNPSPYNFNSIKKETLSPVSLKFDAVEEVKSPNSKTTDIDKQKFSDLLFSQFNCAKKDKIKEKIFKKDDKNTPRKNYTGQNTLAPNPLSPSMKDEKPENTKYKNESFEDRHKKIKEFLRENSNREFEVDEHAKMQQEKVNNLDKFHSGEFYSGRYIVVGNMEYEKHMLRNLNLSNLDNNQDNNNNNNNKDRKNNGFSYSKINTPIKKKISKYKYIYSDLTTNSSINQTNYSQTNLQTNKKNFINYKDA